MKKNLLKFCQQLSLLLMCTVQKVVIHPFFVALLMFVWESERNVDTYFLAVYFVFFFLFLWTKVNVKWMEKVVLIITRRQLLYQHRSKKVKSLQPVVMPEDYTSKKTRYMKLKRAFLEEKGKIACLSASVCGYK